jgi:hypothetical protein
MEASVQEGMEASVKVVRGRSRGVYTDHNRSKDRVCVSIIIGKVGGVYMYSNRGKAEATKAVL